MTTVFVDGQELTVDINQVTMCDDGTWQKRLGSWPKEVSDLTSSIKSIGQQNPIVVARHEKWTEDDPLYEVISGHRRLTAIKSMPESTTVRVRLLVERQGESAEEFAIRKLEKSYIDNTGKPLTDEESIEAFVRDYPLLGKRLRDFLTLSESTYARWEYLAVHKGMYELTKQKLIGLTAAADVITKIAAQLKKLNMSFKEKDAIEFLVSLIGQEFREYATARQEADNADLKAKGKTVSTAPLSTYFGAHAKKFVDCVIKHVQTGQAPDSGDGPRINLDSSELKQLGIDIKPDQIDIKPLKLDQKSMSADQIDQLIEDAERLQKELCRIRAVVSNDDLTDRGRELYLQSKAKKTQPPANRQPTLKPQPQEELTDDGLTEDTAQ